MEISTHAVVLLKKQKQKQTQKTKNSVYKNQIYHSKLLMKHLFPANCNLFAIIAVELNWKFVDLS